MAISSVGRPEYSDRDSALQSAWWLLSLCCSEGGESVTKCWCTRFAIVSSGIGSGYLGVCIAKRKREQQQERIPSIKVIGFILTFWRQLTGFGTSCRHWPLSVMHSIMSRCSASCLEDRQIVLYFSAHGTESYQC